MRHLSSTYEKRGSLVKQVRTRLFFGIGLLLVVLIIHLTVSALTFIVPYNVNENGLTLRDDINIVATGISLLLSLLVIVLLWRTVTRFATALHSQLDILEDTSSRLGEGNVGIRVPALESQELHHLGKTFNMMAEALQQQSIALKDRDVLESVLQLNTLLTSTLDFDTLVTTFLDKALSLLHLQLAALYLYDEQKERLVLASAQGFDFTALTQEFALGEGLVGSTALRRSPFYIRAPAPSEAGNFIAKTILGKVLPGSMYQLPLIQGKDLLGVLVFASLYSISEQARNILTVVSSNLSTVIGHTKVYEYIQAQTEELAAKNREQEQMNIALRVQRNELRVLNITLEENNEARNRFLSTMTHELRTPLTAILGFSQIILRDLECNQYHEQRSRSNIERIIKNGNHLLELVNDTLDLIKIEAGHMSVNMTTVHLTELIPEVIEEIRSLADEKKVTLQTHIAKGIDEMESDPGKLRQILLNLISNAIKFTEKGEVCISVTDQVPAESVEEWGVAITVKDTGIGMAPELQEHIFDAFYQGDSSITRKYGGTGLGLSIVHQLTQLLGGTLELASSPGQGSAFTLFLPLVPVSFHAEQEYEEPVGQV